MALGRAFGPAQHALETYANLPRRNQQHRFAALWWVFSSYWTLWPYSDQGIVAGVAGFEPAHGDTKNRCLTTWLHPNAVVPPAIG